MLRRFKEWLLAHLGLLDKPEEFDIALIMILFIVGLFMVVSWWIFVIL